MNVGEEQVQVTIPAAEAKGENWASVFWDAPLERESQNLRLTLAPRSGGVWKKVGE